MTFRPHTPQISQLIKLFAFATAVTTLTGCGMGRNIPASASPSAITLKGNVHGGQQPVIGGQIFLYQVGNTGNGSAATSLLTSPVTSAADGSFGITGDYTCPDANAPVYLVSEGGDPGVGSANPAITMVAALGGCGDLLANGANTYVSINEVTTVAAAWALAAFGTGPANIGASSTNALGMHNAFLNTALLADTSTGNAAISTATRLLETAKVYSLANSLAACINTAAGSAPCTALFTYATTATTPTDTFTAALNIVQNPGIHTADIYNLAPPTPPYGGGLSAAPNDWTLSSTNVTPAGSCPTGLALDASGIAWVADSCGDQLLAFTAQGDAVAGSPFGSGFLNLPTSVIVDAVGDVWLSNAEQHTGTAPTPNANLGFLTRFQGSGGSTPGALIPNGTSSFYVDPSFNIPLSLTARVNGNFLVSNTPASAGGTQTVTEFNSTGTLVNTVSGPSGMLGAVPDLNGGLWYMFSGSTPGEEHFPAGNYANPVTPACCTTVPVTGATDANGTLWGVSGVTVSAISNTNATLLNSQTVTGLSGASAVVVDAGGIVWPLGSTPLAPNAAVAFVQLSSGTASAGPGALTAGTVLSPANGLGLDANLTAPLALSPDAAGSLWVLDANAGLVQFFGIATPTATPLLPPPTAP